AGVVDDSAFPRLRLPIWVTGADGLPVSDLQPSDLIVTENDQPISSDRLTLEPVAGEPVALVISIDRSTALPDWFDALDAADALLAQLRPGDKAALLVYDTSIDVLATLTDDIGAVRSALDNAIPPAEVIAPDPNIPAEFVDAAVRRAMQFFETEAPGRRAVVLLANGAADLVLAGTSAAPLPAAETGTPVAPANPVATAATSNATLQRLTQLARAGSAPIHVYAYGASAAVPELAQLAVSTGGRALAVSSAQDLAGSTQVLPSLLRQGYQLGYQSSLPADDANHRLAIRLADGEPVERSFVARRSPVLVSITSPAANSQVSGAFPIGVQVQSSSPIVRMAFTLDGGELITTTTELVGGIVWDSATTATGNRTVTVEATDSAGNTGSSALPLTVVAPITVLASMPV
ncbi:MAG: Ig-like domain-containing protein, partial [Caldilineaceae bacterium]